MKLLVLNEYFITCDELIKLSDICKEIKIKLIDIYARQKMKWLHNVIFRQYIYDIKSNINSFVTMDIKFKFCLAD